MPHNPARPCRPKGGFGLVIIMIMPGEADQMRRDIDEIRERREAEHQVVDGRISFQHFKEIIIGSFP